MEGNRVDEGSSNSNKSCSYKFVPETSRVVKKLEEAYSKLLNLMMIIDADCEGKVRQEISQNKCKEIQELKELIENVSQEISSIEAECSDKKHNPIVKTIISKLRNDHKLLLDKLTAIVQNSQNMPSIQHISEENYSQNSTDDEFDVDESQRIPLLQSKPYTQIHDQKILTDITVSDPTLSLTEIRKREEKLRSIEYNITEINQLLKYVSSAVDEQQDCIDIIDTNISMVKDNAVEAAKKLKSAEKSQKSYSKFKSYIIFAIIILFMLYLLVRAI